MQVYFFGDTADDVWQQAAEAFRSGLAVADETSRGGPTQELLHVTFCVVNPRQRWVASRQPSMNPAFGLAEVVWIMAGRNDSSFLNFWNPKLPKYAGYGDTYHGAYGHRLRTQHGLDQLERAYAALKANPSTRQIVLQIWNAPYDLPQEDGRPSAADIPCNIVSLLKIRDGKLHWTQIIRSNDLFLGVPHNFVQFMTLQEIVAGWLGVEPGRYMQWSDSLHVYTRDLAHLELPETETGGAINSDSLALSKEESDIAFRTLAGLLHKMTLADATAEGIANAISMVSLPESHENLLLVVGADATRRLGNIAIANGLMARCSNPLYRHLWDGWVRRQEALQTS